ncbi:2OG-Fe(II) oxygenase [Haloflavibacter putidus]|uniref:2OG-Fe(II) oxygenase n=1 Tax=Haloflavibacter putidus TaxID=2576776 RepID=A0A508A133_9FLAO|nr:2OG-Fe(II) oxygenase [Haloflavibacter putidus]TQD40655.1 2OG-Fe(II) oxygenase [Haloflavibacter putidus]
MKDLEIFEQLHYQVNELYERIIADLGEKHYSIVEDFFNPNEVVALRGSLLEHYQENAFKKSAIGNKVNEEVIKSIRGDFILWIDEQRANTAESLYFNKINTLVDYLNKTCFMGILQKEFHYAVYPKDTFYKRHLDTFQNDERRKLSVVCYLNDALWQDSNGGELVIYTKDDKEEIIDPLPGKIVIFESQLLEHEVKPVLNNKRLSITGWLKTR